MFPIPLYVFNPDGSVISEEGSLIFLPAELATISQLAFYARASKGWSRCPQGYFVYTQETPSGVRVSVPGIVLEGESSPRKKYYFPPLKMTRDKIEKLAASYMEEGQALQRVIETAKRDAEAELGTLIHDLRALSGNIYHASLEAKTDLERSNYSECATRIENVLAAQAVLSLRIDSLDFASNPNLQVMREIPIFRKVDKIVRIFRATGNAKRVRIELDGVSYSSVRGPDVFELIPFAIIDNAIKYSPAGQEITVRASETAAKNSDRVQIYRSPN